ncbi:TetR/AcrR family transcriptional regulator [Streptomyces solicathayae]|uniref:TetR/AcrR family transcriptional regulator n=1 Tax=Streptomyces solicathayae TaxID=3081768 RepID=A0ABZ0LNE0_9ACTN|nr:TetR/AcrR family transcriptional regulator [Streptomyces sp. HUAS YS2]WOX20872.1 TetR/AcrR family transcriptional regulator [Streptomyces sp. HUAS YS2]
MFEQNPANRASSRPAQRRGTERRRAIVDAAEALLVEQGYEGATLKAVSERVGIPITSVYHYFSDRHEVEAALLRRHIGKLDAIVAALLDEPGPPTLRDAVDVVTDALLNYFRSHRDCAEVWFSGRSERIQELVHEFDRVQGERLHTFLMERQLIVADTPSIVLQLSFEAGNRFFDVAFRAVPTGDDVVIDEARRFITAYLETYSAPPAVQD